MIPMYLYKRQRCASVESLEVYKAVVKENLKVIQGILGVVYPQVGLQSLQVCLYRAYLPW
jgi:hypothetical protein